MFRFNTKNYKLLEVLLNNVLIRSFFVFARPPPNTCF